MSNPVRCPGFRLSGVSLSSWGRVLVLVALASVSGCGKPQKPPVAGEVSGYLCPACKAMFYVEQAIVADFCPQCKGTGIQIGKASCRERV